MDNTRTVTWDDPQELGREARGRSGLDYLSWLIAEGRRVPVGTTLGFRLVEVGEGRAVFEAQAGPWAGWSIAARARRSRRRAWRTPRGGSTRSPPPPA